MPGESFVIIVTVASALLSAFLAARGGDTAFEAWFFRLDGIFFPLGFPI